MASPLDQAFAWGPLPSLEASVRFAEARHRALTANIANAETPGYRRQDLDVAGFEEELREAVGARRDEPSTHLEIDVESFVRSSAEERARPWLIDGPGSAFRDGVLRHDGNDVDIEREMALLQKNSSTLRRGASLIKKYLDQLRAAVKGQP